MKIIRHGVFETNSSSTHSFSVDNNVAAYETILPDAEGVIEFDDGEFGWEEETYFYADSKARYVVTMIEMLGGFSEDSDGPGKTLKETFERVVKEHTGCKEIKYNITDGYIDHQSVNSDLAELSALELKNLLFNPESVIETSNDNM